jgi:hypothetical protein
VKYEVKAIERRLCAPRGIEVRARAILIYISPYLQNSTSDAIKTMNDSGLVSYS